MSAYALPGLFPFPPISSASAPSKSDTDGSSSTSGQASCTGPLHQEEDRSTISTIFKAGVDRFYPPLLNSSNQAKLKTEEERNGIEVREAKIDPVRLVQFLTQSPRSQAQQESRKNYLRRRNSKERLNDFLNKSSYGGNSKVDEKSPPMGSPHDEAIEFELSISFNGRKYTATRTMQCIVQLRDDLISEMNNRRRWLQTRASEGPFGTSDVDDVHVQIPEIPPMTGNDNGPAVSYGFVGRGFSMLHAMVTSYVPAMERWLRNIMAVVPQDSECLMNFLWEPLPNDMPPLESTYKSCISLTALGSIKELDYDTGDSDSEDEWEC